MSQDYHSGILLERIKRDQHKDCCVPKIQERYLRNPQQYFPYRYLDNSLNMKLNAKAGEDWIILYKMLSVYRKGQEFLVTE